MSPRVHARPYPLSLPLAALLTAACSAPLPSTDASPDAPRPADSSRDALTPSPDAPIDAIAPPDDATTPAPDAPAPRDAVTPPPDAPPSGDACPPLAIERGVSVGGYNSDRFAWRDSSCRPRSAAMVRNDARDPAGSNGGYLRQYTYEVAGSVRTCTGASDRHSGWGYTINHYDGAPAESSRSFRGTYTTVLAGRHHAIHGYNWRFPINGQQVDVTIHWSFATGRDHPLWSVTFDLRGARADALNADTRSPYGDLLFDGDMDDEVAGVGWGDRYRFESRATGALTMNSPWDYSQPNTIPYVREWTRRVDAEMGAVQTQTYRQHDAGGYWNYDQWGRSSASGPMPMDWNWTYQLNQYELPFSTRSHRIAWGSNYGAVGHREYPAYGDDRMLSGYPFQSYAVYMVLGTHSADPVLAQVAQVEAAQGTALTASVGTVITEGPAGVARTDTAAYEPAGYNHVYGTWEVRAASNRASVRFAVARGSLGNPVLVVRNYAASEAPTRVTLGGEALRADVDYYASVDPATQTLWLTLARALTGTTELAIE